ncbi:MAG: cobalamin-dependent protein, partial [Pseudomonadota bacterium]
MTDVVRPVVLHDRYKPNTTATRQHHIALCTLNAKYIHSSLGLRYLLANLGDLQTNATLQEYTINQRPIDIAEAILESRPTIIGFGVYIWNIDQTTEVMSLIKVLAPEVVMVIGGPEVSHEYENTEVFRLCNHLITGQADHAFRECCESLVGGMSALPKVIEATTPAPLLLSAPYDFYNNEDIKNRILYVEASRGCPFKCEFCLSALDKTATPFDLAQFLADMDKLYQRGARQFKFVDRTFNLKVKSCIAILEFFLERL